MSEDQNKPTRFAGRVASVDRLGESVIINRGENHSIRLGDTFHIVRLGEEIRDPDTGETLGTREILVGRVQVIHVQENISTAIALDEEKVPSRPLPQPMNKQSTNSFLVLLFANQKTGHGRMTPERTLPKVRLEAQPGDYLVRV